MTKVTRVRRLNFQLSSHSSSFLYPPTFYQIVFVCFCLLAQYMRRIVTEASQVATATATPLLLQFICGISLYIPFYL